MNNGDTIAMTVEGTYRDGYFVFAGEDYPIPASAAVTVLRPPAPATAADDVRAVRMDFNGDLYVKTSSAPRDCWRQLGNDYAFGDVAMAEKTTQLLSVSVD